jgi:hypothetical protein
MFLDQQSTCFRRVLESRAVEKVSLQPPLLVEQRKSRGTTAQLETSSRMAFRVMNGNLSLTRSAAAKLQLMSCPHESRL